MKKTIVFCACLLLFACKKPLNPIPVPSSLVHNIEEFRLEGMSDYETLMAAHDSLPANSIIQFAPKTYIFDHTPIIQKAFTFLGPAILMRENQITYTLLESANASSTKIIVNNSQGLITGDRFLLVMDDKSYKGTTSINVINEINGDTLTLNAPLGETVGLKDQFPAGTKLFKNINFFWILSATIYPDHSCTFKDLTFDGNRDNNAGTYSWLLNAAVTALTKGTTTYQNSTFINSPGETIVGHNANIQNCTFLNLNGSGFHTSADKVNCTESEIHSTVSNSRFENTNQISTTIGGHSEGAITHSNSGGYYTATGNTFINVGESVLGAIYPSLSEHDWGTSNITFTDNYIENANRMVYLIDTTTVGVIHDVRIERNTINNLPGYDFEAEINHWTGMIVNSKSGL